MIDRIDRYAKEVLLAESESKREENAEAFSSEDLGLVRATMGDDPADPTP